MKTITLEVEMNFNDALQYLLDGKCLGIRPINNSGYVELFKPKGINPKSPDFMLRWDSSDDNCHIRTNQFLEKWNPVIVNHKNL